ncbi:hypothetical protein N9792_05640 [Planktomarina temperata]|nr:hypothetical protein [Planktomarina temperata]
MNDDNETIDLTSSTSNTIIVLGEGAGADSLDGTVLTASGAVVFDFTDAADTVVLSAASDLTGVTDIDIQGGTVDFTALGGGVNTLAGVNITAASGSILTGSQFLVAGNIGGLDHNLVLELKATDDVDAILTKLQSADVDLAELKVFAPDDLLTPTQKTALESLTNTTVTDLDGGAVDTTNNAPTLSFAETTEIQDIGSPVALTDNAVVFDQEGNWNGGSIAVTVEDGYQFGNAAAAAQTELELAGTATQAGNTYSIIVNGNVTRTDGNGAEEIVGIVNGLTISLNANATNGIVTELVQQIRIDGVSNGTIDDEANVTVTISDADGDSTSFTRQVDSDGAEGFIGMDDNDREVETSTFASGVTVDISANAYLDNNSNLTNNGIDLDGAVMTVSSNRLNDTIDLTAGANYSVVSGNVVHTNAGVQTSIGKIELGTGSATITFNSLATNGALATSYNVDEILQNMTVQGDDIGVHVIKTTIRDSENDASATDTATLTVVDDFKTVTLSELAAADSTADPSTAVNINQNTIITIDPSSDLAALSADLDAQMSVGNIVKSGYGFGENFSFLIRVDVGGGPAMPVDISSVVGLHNLGTVSLNSATNDVTMTTAQAVGFGKVSVVGSIIVTDLQNNTAADLSNITSTGGPSTASIDSGGGVTFTGDLGNFALDVVGRGALTIDASVAHGKTVSATMDETIVVSGVTSSDEYNLSGLTATIGGVIINFDADTTLNSATNLNARGGDIDVAKNVTLTLTAAQADNLTIDGDQALGDNTTGGSIAVTDLDATLAADLSGLTSGGANSGALGTSSGSITAVFSNDGTFTGVLGSATIVTVASGATMTAAETVVDGAVIRGDGNVVVTHGTATDFDLSLITTSSVELFVTADVDASNKTLDVGTASITVDVGKTLTINASDITGVTATGVAADNTETGGSFTVTMDAATALDLSTISAGGIVDDSTTGTAGSLTANIANLMTLSTSTDLGNFDLVLGNDADLSMTAAQAAGRSIDGTLLGANVETLSIDVSSASSTLDISGIGVNIDTTTLISAGSVDLSAMTLDATVGTVIVGDGDNDSVSANTVTMTAAQADDMNTENGATAVVTIVGAANLNGAASDTISLVVTANADDTAGVTYLASDGSDILGGTSGDDDITGGDGADEINGGVGNDSLVGGAGDDIIIGGAGDDLIHGGDGADQINGGDGKDTLDGGKGADTFTTGDGDDTVVINIVYYDAALPTQAGTDFAFSDSGLGSARDTILDFSEAGIDGGDKISLVDSGHTSGEGVVDFDFIGTNSFTQTGAEEVRYTIIQGNAIVEIDADGDGDADLSIQVNDTDVLGVNDFIL